MGRWFYCFDAHEPHEQPEHMLEDQTEVLLVDVHQFRPDSLEHFLLTHFLNQTVWLYGGTWKRPVYHKGWFRGIWKKQNRNHPQYWLCIEYENGKRHKFRYEVYCYYAYGKPWTWYYMIQYEQNQIQEELSHFLPKDLADIIIQYVRRLATRYRFS